jgi:hypothetical protein
MTRIVTAPKPRYRRRKKLAEAAPIKSRMSLPPSLASVCDRLTTSTWRVLESVKAFVKRLMRACRSAHILRNPLAVSSRDVASHTGKYRAASDG